MHFEPLPYMYSKYRDFHCCTVVLDVSSIRVCSDNQNDIIIAIIYIQLYRRAVCGVASYGAATGVT